MRDCHLFGNDAPDTSLARELLKKAGLTRPHDPHCLLVKARIWQRDENISLHGHEIPSQFADSVSKKAKSVAAGDLEMLLG